MSDLNLREGSQETITFLLTAAGAPYNLGASTVYLRRRSGRNAFDSFATTDIPALLVVTDALNGEVEFTPNADTVWLGAAADYTYSIYFEVETAPGVFIAFPEYTNLSVSIAPAFG